MKIFRFLTLASLIVFFTCFPSNKIQAAELITNGSFETGNFTGWTVATAGNGWYPWQVTAAGSGDTTGSIATSSPLFGTRDAWTGFCCNTTSNPEFIQQDVAIPAGQTAEIRWSDKIQSNLRDFCTSGTCGSNVWRVQILNTSNTVLLTLYTYTATYSTSVHNTGWVNHLVDISAFAGQTIRIRFSGTYTSSISNNFNGPGRAEVDGVSIQSPKLVTAANASVSGRVLTSGGRGISLASVTLTDLAGNARAVNTNQFGIFYFDQVESGQTYILTVNHQKYTFPNNSRVISVGEEVTNVDFQANQ